MNGHPATSGIVHKTHLPELVHEMTDPQPRGADHFRQVFLIDAGKNCFGLTLLPQMRQMQKDRVATVTASVTVGSFIHAARTLYDLRERV